VERPKEQLWPGEKAEFDIVWVFGPLSEDIEIKSLDDYPIMYLFILDPKGYIVVPANKKLPPIIAYSFENEFGELSEENVLLRLLKADVSSRIEYADIISENIVKSRNEQWEKYSNLIKINQKSLLSAVGPLLDTDWSQNAPYNNFCPIDSDSGKRSVAGCPAVAMAQILNYHRTTQNVQFGDGDDYYHDYEGNKYTIDDDFEEYSYYKMSHRFIDEENYYEYTLHKLEPGKYYFLVVARDWANNKKILEDDSFEIVIAIPVMDYVLFVSSIFLIAIAGITIFVANQGRKKYIQTLNRIELDKS